MLQNKAFRKKHLNDDPLWYKDAIIYELHVKAFRDSDGNGIGDFRGLIDKLDYLEDLGVTAVWLLPFYPSPLKDDGYDISDFFDVNPDYGNLHEFKDFLKEAHRRGIRVIIELVLNHTSDQHSWFQNSRKAKPRSKQRNFYVWSNTEKYKDARIIFKDFESSNWKWDSVANAYFWHRFYSHQPDLNYDSSDVQKAMFRVINFWLDLGVDGLRLDAVPYLYEREGTNCENLPETHAFLKKMRSRIDSKFKNRMLLAEVNQWPEDAATYYGNGDEVQMCFHFPLMPRMFMAVQMEDRFPIIDIFEQTPTIPNSCQWALFLRNHDELTLEMVADEERDYMYRTYAKDPRVRINFGIRRRLAPLLDNDRRKIELMNVLLISFPGTPVIYYGDEIGMGDNYYLGDRNGVRTPMQWSSDRNAGFSAVNPQSLYLPVIIDPEYHYEVVNVENENRTPSSLLWWMKRLIALRKRFKAFSRGSLEFFYPDNSKVLAFTRKYQEEVVLVVANLSRLSQAVELDLAKLAGFVPLEVFGKSKFPVIRDSPYVLTLAPYDFYIFSLQKEAESVGDVKERVIPEINVWPAWANLLWELQIEELDALQIYLQSCRWFGGKTRDIQKMRILDDVPIPGKNSVSHFFIIEVNYVEGLPETYSLPLSIATKDEAQRIIKEFPQSAVAKLRFGEEEGVLYDSMYDKEFRENLLAMIFRRKRNKGKLGSIVTYPSKTYHGLLDGKGGNRLSEIIKGEQSNTSIKYGDAFIFKLFRRLEVGINPDLEIGRFLTEKTNFTHIPPFAGGIEYWQANSEPMVIGLLQGFVPNQGDAWNYTLGVVDQYFERVLSKKSDIQLPPPLISIMNVEFSAIPQFIHDLIGAVYLEMIRLLGQRTGELHLALSSVSDDLDFAPESFSILYQRSVYQNMRGLTRRTMQFLSKNLKKLPENIRKEAAEVVSLEPEILRRMQKIMQKRIPAMKIRSHGDYHLGQVLYTGNNFVIFDFEGEPLRSLSERRLKRSPLRDVAGMIRSFHYAAYSALLHHGSIRPEDVQILEPWTELWFQYISGVFLTSYLDTVKGSALLPDKREDIETLLQSLILEKVVYELDYELNNRPNWVIIPIKGIKYILRGSAETSEVK